MEPNKSSSWRAIRHDSSKGQAERQRSPLEESEIHPLAPPHSTSPCGHSALAGMGRVSHCSVSQGSLTSARSTELQLGNLLHVSLAISSSAHWTRVLEKIFCLCESTIFVHFQFQIATTAGKPALKNKACIEIDCFPVAVPVVLGGLQSYRYLPWDLSCLL